MATFKTTEEQLADVKRFNEALRTHLKKANEELTATRINQRTLIELLADTMKRLRKAETTIEEEKKKQSLLSLLQRAETPRDPWRVNLWTRACEALPCEALPCEARACEARTCEALPCEALLAAEPRPCDTSESTPTQPASTSNPPQDDEDLYA
jgi:hypothetical protein